MPKRGFIPEYFLSDLMAGVVVFLVALPLCLGVPLAARAPLFSGIVAGIVGGIVCLLYTSPSPRDGLLARMPSSA